MKCCHVRTCNSQNDSNRMYHKFPCDPIKRKEWFQVLGLKKNDKSASLYVCGKHFRFKDYCSGGKRLKPEAVPSLKLNVNSNHKSQNKVSKEIVIKPENKTEPKKLSSNRRPCLTQHNIVTQPRKTVKSPPLSHCETKHITSRRTKEVMNKDLEKDKILNDNSRGTKRSSRTRHQDKPRSRPLLTDFVQQPEAKEKPRMLKSSTVLSSIAEENSFGHSEYVQHLDNVRACASKKATEPITSTPNQNTKNSKSKLNISVENTSFISTTFTIPNDEIVENVPETPVMLTLIENLSTSEVKLKTSPEKVVENRDNQSKKVNTEVSENKKDLMIENRPNSSTKTEIQNKPKSTNTPKADLAEFLLIKEPSSVCGFLSENDGSQHKSNPNNELEETIANYRTKRQRTKRKRLISTDSESCERDNTNLTKKVFSSKTNVGKKSSTHSSLTRIEETIKEMQTKIDQLEKKSVLDEKRVEAFKSALIKQRNLDIKVIMDEKENELLLRMELLYLDYDPQKICRLCLVQVENQESLTPLFLPQENCSLLSMIKNTINIDIKYDEKMPMGICGECMIQIQRIDWMKKKSQRSNHLIHKFTLKKKGTNNSTPAATTENTSEEDKPQHDDPFNDESISEVKIEDVFSLNESGMMDIKQEPQSDEELMIPADDVEFDKRGNDKPRKCRDCQTTFTRNWSWNHHVKWCRRVFQCSECSKCFWNGELFSRHCKSKFACRSEESSRTCDECQIVFRWKYQYLFHLATGICVLE